MTLAAVKASHDIDLNYLVRALLKYNASDLHIKVSRPPLFRINGQMIPAKMSPLSQNDVTRIVMSVLSEKQKHELESKKNIDLSVRFNELGRFRCNIYYQRGTLAMAVRMIPSIIPKFDDLAIPPVVKDLCQRNRGLIFITGSTGSGKSTTLAALTQYLNENFHFHILTVEDPIEFVYKDCKSSVTQREVGSDALGIKDALVAGLRQDPDVIVIGEIRDRESIEAALTAAETGHLVITTLHTNDARSTIDRILDVFKGDAQNQIRIQLASSLVGVLSQQLVLRADGSGRILACEVLVKSPAVENYILRNELERIPEAMEMSTSYYKMQTMNQALQKLVDTSSITKEEALKSSAKPEDLKLKLEGIQREEGYRQGNSK